jgi:hypothetical protein
MDKRYIAEVGIADVYYIGLGAFYAEDMAIVEFPHLLYESSTTSACIYHD